MGVATASKPAPGSVEGDSHLDSHRAGGKEALTKTSVLMSYCNWPTWANQAFEQDWEHLLLDA